MKILHYALGISLLISGIESIFITKSGNVYACPRCRRALPKGPLKHPHPSFPKKERNTTYSASTVNQSIPQRDMKEKFNEQK